MLDWTIFDRVRQLSRARGPVLVGHRRRYLNTSCPSLCAISRRAEELADGETLHARWELDRSPLLVRVGLRRRTAELTAPRASRLCRPKIWRKTLERHRARDGGQGSLLREPSISHNRYRRGTCETESEEPLEAR
jgi:hypothetical protein